MMTVESREGNGMRGRTHTTRLQPDAGLIRRSALDDHIPHDLPAWAERLLRLAVQLGADATGIAQRDRKLVLRLPLSLLTGTQ